MAAGPDPQSVLHLRWFECPLVPHRSGSVGFFWGGEVGNTGFSNDRRSRREVRWPDRRRERWFFARWCPPIGSGRRGRGRPGVFQEEGDFFLGL